ncbi:MAG: hypothetical protein JKY34_16005 [Kordiimonadaceae bacterium]|nr:hypothetical protein [Kordiimonadaceae bacterium]
MADIKTEYSKCARKISEQAALDYISHRPVITVDYEKYSPLLNDPDLTEDQKREFLQAVWNVVVGFVDLGFGVHPIQQVQNSCGESMNFQEETTLFSNNSLNSKGTKLTDQFADATDHTEGGAPNDFGLTR